MLVVQGGPFYTFEGVLVMIFFYEEWSLQVTCWFPCAVALRVPLPFDEVLQLFSPSMMLVATDGLDLVLFFIMHEVRGWSGIVLPMFYCLDIWGKE